MKKIITLLLAVILVFVITIPAFAAPDNKNIDVKAKYTNSSVTPEVYSVDVTWGAMEFTYTIVGNQKWGADTHTYSKNVAAGWTASGNTVTVTNHSNKGINAAFAYTKSSGFNEISGSFSKSRLTLPSAVGKSLTDSTLTGTSQLTLSGTLSEAVTSLTKVGTITVTVD